MLLVLLSAAARAGMQKNYIRFVGVQLEVVLYVAQLLIGR